MLDPMDVVSALAALPHRGTGTAGEAAAADLLEAWLQRLGAQTIRAPFSAPTSFVWYSLWLVLFLAAALLLSWLAPWPALLLAFFATALFFWYFTWRRMPLDWLVPRAPSQNLLARLPNAQGSKTLVLMAHCDTAHAAHLWNPTLVSGYTRTIIINYIVALLVPILGAAVVLLGNHVFLTGVRSAILFYLIAQIAILIHGHLGLPYVNGANDNATGVALALALADRLWRQPLANWQVEVVITGSEEVSLMGAKVYVERHLSHYDPKNVAVLNLDTCGLGQVHAIDGEGLLVEPVKYQGPLLMAARTLATEVPVVAYRWGASYYDGRAVAQAGYATLTVTTFEGANLYPTIHWTSDVLANVDPDAVYRTLAYLERLVKQLTVDS